MKEKDEDIKNTFKIKRWRETENVMTKTERRFVLTFKRKNIFSFIREPSYIGTSYHIQLLSYFISRLLTMQKVLLTGILFCASPCSVSDR